MQESIRFTVDQSRFLSETIFKFLNFGKYLKV